MGWKVWNWCKFDLLDSFYHDFERDAELIEDYNHFAENMIQKGLSVDKSMASLLEKAMKRKVISFILQLFNL